MQGGEMTLYPDNQQKTVQPHLSPFEGRIIPEMPFQQTNNPFSLNLTNTTAVVQESLACHMPVNNFNILPDNTNVTAATNVINNVDSFSNITSISRLLDLDTQQSVEMNSDFSLSLLGGASLTHILGDSIVINDGANADIEENMSDSLRNMSLENNN